MRNAFFSLILLFAGAVVARAQSVDDIIAKHVEVIGGDNWNKVQAVKMEAKVTAQSAPGMEIPLNMVIVREKSLRMEVSVMGMTQITVVHGDGGWMINPFTGKKDPEPLTADMVRELKDMTDLDGSLIGYKEKGYTIENMGVEDVDGTEAYKLKVDKGSGRIEYQFIDKETNYIIKQTTVANMDGKEVESSTTFSDFRTVEGVVFPGSIQQENPMMGTSVTTLTNITINPTVDEATFAMPTK